MKKQAGFITVIGAAFLFFAGVGTLVASGAAKPPHPIDFSKLKNGVAEYKVNQ